MFGHFCRLLCCVALVSAALATDEDMCNYNDDPPNPIYDRHDLTDTVYAVAIWAIPDSATWLNLFPNCEEFLPESYDMPDFADAIWDSNYATSASRFYLDNSNHHHYVTAETPRSPAGGLWVISGDVYDGNGWWDAEYIRHALDTVDASLDFADFDHDSNGVVDQLIFYDYHLDGRGTVRPLGWQSDDSIQTSSGHVPVRVDNPVAVRTTQGNFWLSLELTAHEYGHTFDISDLYFNAAACAAHAPLGRDGGKYHRMHV